jgi:hypothetical protein
LSCFCVAEFPNAEVPSAACVRGVRAVSGGRGVLFVPPLSAGQHVSTRRLGGAHGRRRRRPTARPAGVHGARDAAGTRALAAAAAAQAGPARAHHRHKVRRRRHPRRPHHGRRRRQPAPTQLTPHKQSMM